MLIIQSDEYKLLCLEAESILIKAPAFPAYVFKERAPHHYFVTNDEALDWKLILNFASSYGDKTVKFLCLEPNGRDFWFSEQGHFGSFMMNVSDGEAKWNENIDANCRNALQTLRICSIRFLVWGTTGSWHLFCDLNWEAAVIGILQFPDNKPLSSGVPLKVISEMMKYWKNNRFQVDGERFDVMKDNYK